MMTSRWMLVVPLAALLWSCGLQEADCQPARRGPLDLQACASLRAAIEDLTATFNQRYLKGRDYRARLDRLQAEAEKAGARADVLRADLESLRREALVASPLVSAQPLV